MYCSKINIKWMTIIFLVVINLILGLQMYDTYKQVKSHEKRIQELESSSQKHQTKTETQKPVGASEFVGPPRHPYDDVRWATRYRIDGEKRSLRYGTTSKKYKVDKTYAYWKGGKRIHTDTLTTLVKGVLVHMPHIRSTPEMVSLIVETSIAESDGGRILDMKSGDYGILQIRLNTVHCLLDWLKATQPDIHKAVLSFKDTKLSMKDNLIHNVPFSIAVAVTEYWRKMGPNIQAYITTMEDRGIAWKSVYNSAKGLGTVNKYVRRNLSYTKRMLASK